MEGTAVFQQFFSIDAVMVSQFPYLSFGWFFLSESKGFGLLVHGQE